MASYFKVYLDFALMTSEESGAYTVWTGILDNRLIAKQETMEEVHAVSGDIIITALLKECRGLDKCVRELRRTPRRATT